MTLKNRLVLAPLPTYSSNGDGTITQAEIEFLDRRSRGVGMVITPSCYVLDSGRAYEGQWGCSDDDKMSGLRQAAEAIKRAGAIAVLQLSHAGRLAPASLIGHAPLAPSPVPAEYPGADLPGELSELEIEGIIEAFGKATRRAIRAGFDGVEINGADGGLLQQFFSPHANRRSDQWGGTLESRAAIPIAVLEEVQEIVRGNAYTPFSIGYNLSPEEAETPGISLEETMQLVEGLVSCRPDWLRVATPEYFGGSLRNPADRRPRARVIAETVKGRTKVIGGGGIVRPEEATSLLADGIDLVGLGRVLVTDPEWVQKILSGEADSICECIPATGADEMLEIPGPMYHRILQQPDWIPVCAVAPGRRCEKHQKVPG